MSMGAALQSGQCHRFWSFAFGEDLIAVNAEPRSAIPPNKGCCTFPSESRALFRISGGQQNVKFGSVQPILRPTPEFATSPDRPPTSRSRALHGAGAGCVRAHTPSPRNEYSAFAVLSLLILPSSE